LAEILPFQTLEIIIKKMQSLYIQGLIIQNTGFKHSRINHSSVEFKRSGIDHSKSQSLKIHGLRNQIKEFNIQRNAKIYPSATLEDIKKNA
jgi:hypothetical protein